MRRQTLSIPVFTPAQLARFRGQLRRTENGCLVWTGETTNHGYGQFAIYPDGKRVRFLTHRISYSLSAPLSETEILRHSCDNPPCCEPSHLLPGTQQQNIQDAVERGRINTSGLKAYRDAREAAALARIAAGLKTCAGCLNEKSVDEFHLNRSRFDGRAHYCKSCVAARQAARAAS